MTIDGQDTNTTLKKTTGYDSGDNNGSGSSDSDDGNMADKYYTYNYTVKKNITGTLADKKHEFPFTVKTTASNKAGQKFFVKKNIFQFCNMFHVYNLRTEIHIQYDTFFHVLTSTSLLF